jgi:pheromone shutdown protein TraB
MMPFPTPSNLFLLQLTWTAIIFAVFVILGYVGGEIAKIAFESWLQSTSVDIQPGKKISSRTTSFRGTP